MSERKPCKSDSSDERGALIEPVITAWKAQRPSASGHEGRYGMREIVNASLLVLAWGEVVNLRQTGASPTPRKFWKAQ